MRWLQRCGWIQHAGFAALAAVLLSLAVGAAPVAAAAAPPRLADPPVDRGYHDDAEIEKQLTTLQTRFPGLVSRSSLGSSFEGRPLWLVKISDNVVLDENEPEVLLVAGQHGREHLTVEMALHVARDLAAGYRENPRINRIVDAREIWIAVDVNPDGSAYDRATGRYRFWRKNRQRLDRGAIGVDLNRNWGFRWGCCGGSSGVPRSSSYRGAAPFSAPETRHLRDFVASRAIGGVQQIRAALDFHSHSELVLWPFGYTRRDVAPGLDQHDQAAFAALGAHMAATNGYRAMQQSALYIADGTMLDWLWAVHRIHGWALELYPGADSAHGFYPPASVIERETARNREAILALLDTADCITRVADREAARCGLDATTVFSDDFEAATGWRTDPAGTDSARAGRWRRGRPGPASHSVGMSTAAGPAGRALTTGVGSEDVDRGVTSVLSPPVALDVGGRHWLRFASRLDHDDGGSRRDGLRVSAVTAGGERHLLFERRASRGRMPAAWVAATVSLDAHSGRPVRFLVEAVDAGRDGLVEAAIDDLRVTREASSQFP